METVTLADDDLENETKNNEYIVQGTLVISNDAQGIEVTTIKPSTSEVDRPSSSQSALRDLQLFLEANATTSLKFIREQPFASVSLTSKHAQRAQDLLWTRHAQFIREQRASEVERQQVTITRSNGKPITMKYWSKLYCPTNGKKTSQPIPLFIGLHGGGGCPPKTNDSQWENHKKIYDKTYQTLANKTQSPLLYIAPRAPTNNWNLWHEPHMDELLDRLIETMVATQHNTVDSNRVYISGYSAGGDGIYKLAPRMADRWAAASMMAGHPNGVSLRGVYNLPFSLHVGGKDAAYNRNKVGRKYKDALEQWQQEEQGRGYQEIWAKIYKDNGHGLGGQDAAAMEWMAKFKRDANPTTLVWDKASARHDRFYWVLRSNNNSCGGGEIRVTREGQKVLIDLTKCPQSAQVESLTFRFNDSMVDMERPIEIYRHDKTGRLLLAEVQLTRTIGDMCRTLAERGDPNAVYYAQVKVDLREGETIAEPPKRLRGRAN